MSSLDLSGGGFGGRRSFLQCSCIVTGLVTRIWAVNVRSRSRTVMAVDGRKYVDDGRGG